MMATVTDTLLRLGLLGAGEVPRYQLGLTHGDTLWLDAFRRDGSFYHVKVSEYVSLCDEVRAYRTACEVYPDHIPAVLGYVVREGWEIFVAEGVEHRALSANPLTRRIGAREARTQILRFFDACPKPARGKRRGLPHATLLESLRTTFGATRFAPLVEAMSGADARLDLDGLGELAQHGDFVANNIGTRAGRLVVYDWEDFGKTHLPGLDLCTLAASFLGELDANASFATGGSLGDDLRGFLRPACASLGLELAQFLRLVPLYLLVFLGLKQGYAAGIRNRIEQLLDACRVQESSGLSCVTD